MRIAVAGGTGVVGRLVVEEAEEAGHEAVVISRSRGVDLVSGEGLAGALAGAEAIIDASSVRTFDPDESVAFFDAATGNLERHGEQAGVRHLVVLSIVGCDRVDTGYYMGKRRQEELALAGPLPVSILRATQFHEFAAQMVARAEDEAVVAVPAMHSQPIAAREVAAALVGLAVGEPVGRAEDLAGPEELDMVDMVRRLLEHRGLRREVVARSAPAELAAQMKTGLIPDGPGPRGAQTFAEWLLEQ
ncbi:SDR family oxidoreductase [Actinokineospora sp. G85]|uniref:SDR family oxidoreductase n=1 Tax=Actinokineospora sp. G85 TaxID=3406626 RepID=UPI003C77EBEC